MSESDDATNMKNIFEYDEESFKMSEGDDATNMKNIFEDVVRNISLKTGSFVVPIILYIISFFQLFNHSSAEYLSWILLFILNNTFPFVWMKEFVKMGTHVGKSEKASGSMILYSYMSIIVTYFFQFIILLFVILKNENVRSGKERRGEYEKEGNQNIKTNNFGVELRDKIISILFITSNVLIWAMVGDLFSTYLDPTKTDIGVLREDFPIGTRIKAFTDLIPGILDSMDRNWHGLLSVLMPFPNLSKAFLMYCITFLIVIFSFFIRFKYRRIDQKKQKDISGNRSLVTDDYDIVNIGNLFGDDFYNNIIHYRNLAKVVLVLLITVPILFLIGYFIFKSQLTGYNKKTSLIILLVVIIICIVISLSVLFSPTSKLFESNDREYYTEDIVFQDLSLSSTINSNFPNHNPNPNINLRLFGENTVRDIINRTAYLFNQEIFISDGDDKFYNVHNKDKNTEYSGVNVTNTEKNWKYLEHKYKNLDTEIPYIDKDMLTEFTKDQGTMIHFQHNMEQIYGNSTKLENKSKTHYKWDRINMANDSFYGKSFTYNDTLEFKWKKKILESKKNNKQLKQFIFFLMCLFFGILGSPVVITLFELLIHTLSEHWFLAATTNSLFCSFISFMLVLTFTMFGIGNGEDFLKDHNYKKLQTFLAVLITMAISSLFALSTQYNIFLGIWKIPGSIISMFLKTFAPLLIMLFTSLSMFYSYENYKIFRKITAE